MKPPLLSDEEIKSIFLSHFTNQYGDEAAKDLMERLPECNYAKAISRAQYDLMIKWFNEWLDEQRALKGWGYESTQDGSINVEYKPLRLEVK